MEMDSTQDLPVVQDAPPAQAPAKANDATSGFVTTTDDMPKAEVVPEPAEKDSKPDGEVDQSQQFDEIRDDQKSLDAAVIERETAKIKAEKLEKKIQELEAKNSKEKADTDEPLDPSDFDDYHAYLDAKEAQEAKASEPKAKDNDADQDQGIELTDSQRIAHSIVSEKLKNLKTKPDDFEAVVMNEKVPFTPQMLEALATCDDPAKVMYHLGKNEDFAREIANNSAAQQMRQITSLDLTLKAKPQKPAQISKTPDPISPVGGVDALRKNPSEMSFTEYQSHRASQKRSSGGWS